ncbi:hypothetical protein AALC25_10290 [Lachnospiraceae bacterium 29-84]
MQRDDIRAELIKQFPAEVMETRASINEVCYSCPTCNRMLSKGMDKCGGCGQILSWKNIEKKEGEGGMKKAVLEFEVSAGFTPGDCRQCPISFVENSGTSGYECPLRMRGDCRIKIS